MDLVALATVADVVPLTGANRILVAHGLQELTAGPPPRACARSRRWPGMEPDAAVTAGQVGFRLGPRINAAGRLHDASLGPAAAVRRVARGGARRWPQVLDRANAERQGIESDILTEALAQAEALDGTRAASCSTPRAGTRASSASSPRAWWSASTGPPSWWA